MYMYIHVGASPKTIYGKYEEKRRERERVGKGETGERKKREGGREIKRLSPLSAS